MADELHEHISVLRERVTRLETTLATAEKDLSEVASKLDALLSKLDRYEGKLGGVLIAAAAFVAFFKFIFSEGLVWLQKVMN